MLDECTNYLDGTLFNLKEKVTDFQLAEMSVEKLSPDKDSNNQGEKKRRFNISSKMQKLRY